MTAVEWLDRWFRDNPESTHEEGNKALKQAKQMEKKQIIDAWENGAQAEHRAKVTGLADSNSYSYYNETYGNKGNNYLIVEANEMVEKSEKPIIPELSDEEIEREAEQKYAYKVSDTDIKGMIVSAEKGAWINACKWYREQLKQRQ